MTCLFTQNCGQSTFYIISLESADALKVVITDVPLGWSARIFVENLKIEVSIQGISKQIHQFREILWKSSICRFQRTQFSVNGDYFPVITPWLIKNIEKIIAASAAMIFSMFLKYTPFTWIAKIDLSQFWRSTKPDLISNSHKFRRKSIGKHVKPHTGPYKVTVKSKYDTVVMQRSRTPHVLKIIRHTM